VQGLGRGRIAALVDNGLDTIGKVLNAPVAQLQKIVTKGVAERIQKYKGLADETEADSPDTEDEMAGIALNEPEAVDKTSGSAENLTQDDDNALYRSNAVIHIDGQIRKKRYLIRVNGKDAWVRPQPFEAAFMMVIRAKQDSGWISGPLLSQDKYHQVFYRLKHDLKCTGVDVRSLIENNEFKQYRFSVPPENITFDKEKIRLNEPELAQLLEAEENAA